MQECRRILVIEDNEDTRELIVRILGKAGYRVESAANGAEALRRLKRTVEPTLILLDLMMPVMDGWDFLKLRRRGHHRVVTISAFQFNKLDNLFDGKGVDANLPKPLFAGDLLAIAERFCRQPGLQQDHQPSP